MARPTALGLDVSVRSLSDADAVLHEMAWIGSQKATLAAQAKQRIDAIKVEAEAKAVVEVEGQMLSLDQRLETLSVRLAKWVAANAEKHLTGKRRSMDLAHGKIGLRQQPLVAMLGDEATDASVLDAIDEQTGLVVAVNAILERRTTLCNDAGKAKAGDLISVEIKPAYKSMKDALEAKRVTREQLAALGVSVRDPYDEPVLTPSKNVVFAEVG